MARYDLKEKKWDMIGGILEEGRFKVLAKDADYIPYVPRVIFDRSNRMHVSLMWRLGGPGRGAHYPSYFYSDDKGKTFYDINGIKLSMPVSVHLSNINIDGSEQKYYAITDIAADHSGKPYILVHKYKSKYVLYSYDKVKQKWGLLENFPPGASAIKVEKGRLYAFASGPVIYVKDIVKDKWKVLAREKGKRYCNPKIADAPADGQFYFYTQSCDLKTARIYRFDT